MGARIAAHFANAGFPVDLFDLVLPNQPNRSAAALAGIESAAKQKPVGFYTDAARELIAKDPYTPAGIIANIELKEWNRVFPPPAS